MKWSELEDKKIRGVMPDGRDLIIFLQDKALRVTSHNQDYSWYDNWDITEEIPKEEWPERDSTYKTIQETVQNVWTDGYDKDSTKIQAEMSKWIDAVGKGRYNAKDGEQYTFLKLELTMRVIEFGTVYYDCHYPSTVWDVVGDSDE